MNGKPGRPPLPPKMRKTSILCVRLKEEERGQLDETARVLGVRCADIVRAAIFETYDNLPASSVEEQRVHVPKDEGSIPSPATIQPEDEITA